MKAEKIKYTEKDLAAIQALKANAGVKLTAKELGFANGTLTSLINKSIDPRPMEDGVERVIVNKEKVVETCPTCGNEKEKTVYWVEA